MTKRKKSQSGGEQKTLPPSNSGQRPVLYDEEDVIRLLRAAVKREGTQTAFAKRYGVDRARVNRVLQRKLRVYDPIAKALGLRKVYVAE